MIGDDGVGTRGARESLALRGGEHLGRILQHAAAGDGVAGRRGDGVVEVAVLEIELALAEVRIGVPAADVVVDRHARIPLRDLVERAVAPHPVGAVLGHAEGEAHRDGEPAAARRDGLLEIDAPHGVVDVHGGGAAVDLERHRCRSPPRKPRTPQRESAGKSIEPLLPGRYRFWSSCSQTKRSVSGELLV